MDKIGETLADVTTVILASVIIFDSFAWFAGVKSVSARIRESSLSWPVAIMAAIVVGGVVVSHFVTNNLPGK
jgi:hypothetical protein